MSKQTKVGSAGKFKAKFGVKPRNRYVAIEVIQRKKQTCIVCNKPGVKREAAGIWSCKKCGAKFASDAYYLPVQA